MARQALSLAETFQDYSSICFNDNKENLFYGEIFDQAVAKAIELKEPASEDELEHLVDDEDHRDNIKQLDPTQVPT
ncbi:MAG: hypothetical protein P8L20_08850 [Flavobacteriales bacterium]|nr:hypothetical protein [Flavobacteriales bacterium]